MENEENNNEPEESTPGLTAPEEQVNNTDDLMPTEIPIQDNAVPGDVGGLRAKNTINFNRGDDGNKALDVVKIVEDLLPSFVQASKSETDEIIVHTDAFGETFEELILLGSAIKYATRHDKNITIVK